MNHWWKGWSPLGKTTRESQIILNQLARVEFWLKEEQKV